MAGAVIDDVLGIILLAVITGVAAAKGKGNLETPSVPLIAIRAFLVWIGFTATVSDGRHIIVFLKDFIQTLLSQCFSWNGFHARRIFEKAGLAMIIGAYIMGLTSQKQTLASQFMRLSQLFTLSLFPFSSLLWE
jgi:Kef-type K+ transport system membrane component KefB